MATVETNPTRLSRQTTRRGWANRGRSAWQRVWCPRAECANAEGYLVYAPLARDGRTPSEVYQCAVCRLIMNQERANHAGRA